MSGVSALARGVRGCVVSATLWAAACSLFVEQEIKNVRCQDTNRLGPPACDIGQICGQGRCHVCEARELCGDGFDNNCNGMVEEGCDATGAQGGAGGTGDSRQAGAAGESDAGSSSGGSAPWRDPFP